MTSKNFDETIKYGRCNKESKVSKHSCLMCTVNVECEMHIRR